MRRLLAVLAVSTALLAACSDDPTPTSISTSSTTSASATASASASGSGSPVPVTSSAATPPQDAEPETTTKPSPEAVAPVRDSGTGLSEQAPSGGPLTVTAVRVARQDGYDRVVFELDGEQAGEPGWRVEYVDVPRRAGSGDPVDVDGDATLAVLIDGVGYPFDTGVDEAREATVGGDLEVVQDIELGAVYEGAYEAFVGVSRTAPFRVFRLADPARVVIDIEHG